MRKETSLLLAVLMCVGAARAAPMNFRVIQPPYGLDASKVDEDVKWEMDALARCDASLDVIVLPEASDRQARVGTKEEVIAAAKKHNAPLLALCAETAKRCGAIVFVNALDFSHGAAPRNTTFAFDRTGALVGRYDKRHLTAGGPSYIGLKDD